MSQDWRTCTRGNECPICGSDHYCSISGSGDCVQCSLPKRMGETAAAPDGWQMWKPTKGGGMLYRRLGGDGKPIKGTPLSDEEKRKREEQRKFFKERSFKISREAWRRAAQFDHRLELVENYLHERGIDVLKLPESELPRAIRFDPQCPDITLVPGITAKMAAETGEKPRAGVTLAWPAMLCAISDRNGELAAIHRTYLGLEARVGSRPQVMARKRRDIDIGVTGERLIGKGKKAIVGPIPGFGAARKMLSEVKGNAVRLGRTYPNGVLILAEGIETALACMVGTACTAWACLSADGLQSIEIAEAIVDRGVPGRVRTIIIAEDLDAKGTGGRSASVLVGRLSGEYPWLQIRRAAPMHEVCPELVKSDQTPEGKKVDWLDVLNSAGKHSPEGRERVRKGLLELSTVVHQPGQQAAVAVRKPSQESSAPSPTPPTAPNGRNASGTRTDDESAGGAGGRGSVGVVSGGDDGGSGGRADLYRPTDEEFLPLIASGPVNQARRYLVERCMVEGGTRFGMVRWNAKWWRYVKGVYQEIQEERLQSLVWSWLNGFAILHRDKRIPYNPKPEDVKGVVKALAIDTVIDSETPGAWLGPTIIDGVPQWGRAASDFDGAVPVRDGRRADMCLVFPNGVLDMMELLRTRKVVLHPLTPDLFSTTMMPYPLPVEDLQRLIDGADRDEVYQRLCPHFISWLDDAAKTDADDEPDPGWQEQLQIMLGDTVTGDRSIEKIFLVVGVKRAGKGIIGVVLETIMGEQNIASINATLLGDKFGPSSLIGKRAALWPDAHLTQFDQGGAITETLKSIRGRDRLPMRDLYGPYSTARITARVWITANEELDLRDESGALAGSMIILPMRNSAAGRENEDLKDLIRQEGAGLMVFALEGAVKLWSRKPRQIPVCGDGRDVQGEYVRMSSHVEQFVREVVKWNDDQDVYTTPGQLHEAYEWWCEHVEHRTPKGRGGFYKSVKWFLPKLMNARDGDKRSRRWLGMSISEEVREGLSKSNTKTTEWGRKADDDLIP